MSLKGMIFIFIENGKILIGRIMRRENYEDMDNIVIYKAYNYQILELSINN